MCDMNDPVVHVDGGLIGNHNASYITAALQALLHVLPLSKVLEEDRCHREKCRSLLKCLLCAIIRARCDLKSKGLADVGHFQRQWNYLSCAMTPERQIDPHEVLVTFLYRMRADMCETLKAQCCTDYFHQLSPVSNIFEGELLLTVTCSSCGKFSTAQQFLCVEVAGELTDDLSGVLHSHFSREKQDLCVRCRRSQSLIVIELSRLPNTLVIHCAVSSPQFKVQGRFAIARNEYELVGCIVDDSSNPFFIGICPDGKLRVFDGAKIKVISPAKFYQSEFLTTSKLTLLYSKIIKKIQKVGTSSSTVQRKVQSKVLDSNKIKIVSYPIVNEDDIPTQPLKSRTVATQTECVAEKPMVNNAASRKDPPVKKLPTKLVRLRKNPVKKTKAPLITYESCKRNKKFKFFTGLCAEDFEVLYQLIGGDEVVRNLKMFYRVGTPKKTAASKLSGRDRLFMLLLRMRRGLPLEELSFMFSCGVPYVGEICYVMTRLVYLTLKSMESYMFIPAARQCIGKPKVMKPFPNLRVILDGASFYIETPSNFEQQGNTFSNYKKRNVVLFAVGIGANGATVFCSEGFEGSMSDKQTIVESGLLDMLEPGDGVMTDRGYELTAELQEKGCHFYKPPSLGDRANLSAEEEILTKALASARIYSEHAIADIKDWRILQGTIPILLVPVLSNLVYIAAFLRNFNPNRIRNKKFVSVPNECVDQQGNGVG